MKIPLGNLRAFEAAARLLSFTLAAEELHISQSAVSQQIRQLEDWLGFKLFRRLTRRLELTDGGRRLQEAVARALRDIDGAVEDLREGTRCGPVAMSVGTSFAANWLIPRLCHFQAAFPEIDLRIRPSDSLVDLRAEASIDVSVRFAQKAGRGLVVVPLAMERVFVVCSPSLLRGRGRPESPGELGGFPLLHNEVSDGEVGAAGDWSNWLAGLGLEGVLDVVPGPRVPRSDLLVQAAVHGQGMALVWDTMVLNELRDGRLIKALGGEYETANRYYATCTRESYASPKVRAVMDWLEGAALEIEI